MDIRKNIMIVGEYADNVLTPITLELLGIGRILANDLKEELTIVFAGSSVPEVASEAIAFGADKVIIANNPALHDYNPDAVASAIIKLCREMSPYIVILGQTDMSIDLAPRLAAKLQGGLSMDCIKLSIDPKSRLLLQTRPVFGGNAHATYVATQGRLQIATIRPHAISKAVRNDSRKGEVVMLDIEISPTEIRTQVIEKVKQEAEGIKLEEARFIIAGGHGLGSVENCKKLQELAQILGSAVGATRPVCEEGWIAATSMIGQTGKIVSPDVYLTMGISGAMQHIAGCGQSKCIIAVNNNPDAQIFKTAHYGVVADCNEIIPELKNRINRPKPN